MAQQKGFLKHQKAKKAQLDPETPDEFLAAGVEKEEAGEKWRAGDAAKSSRFFVRAIEIYDQGLQRFPQSFDLAYNKARLQYEVSQQPRLLQHLPTPPLQVLRVSLDSHRYALNLKHDDADTLFNAAQVLTSLGEALVESTATTEFATSKTDAIPLLQEAVELFEKCLNVQQIQLQGIQEASQDLPIGVSRADDSSSVGQPPPTTSSPSTREPEQEEWASVIETITPAVLLETCLAEIHALSTLLPLLPPDPTTHQNLTTHSEALLVKASSLSSTHLPGLQEPQAGPTLEHAHARLSLLSALANLSYRSGLTDAPAYLSSLSSTWDSSTPSLSSHGPAQADYAEALLNFNAAMASPLQSVAIADLTSLRWTALTRALTALSTANTSPGPASRAAINGRRGDAELLRARLGEANVGYEQAVKNREQLLKNAEIYYDGARKIAGVDGDGEEEVAWRMRVGIARELREHGIEGLKRLIGETGEEDMSMNEGQGEAGRIRETLLEMREEGLLP